MFSSFISLGLSWLPGPLGILVALASIVLGLLVLIRIVKAIVELVKFVMDMLGGVIGKVVSWFL